MQFFSTVEFSTSPNGLNHLVLNSENSVKYVSIIPNDQFEGDHEYLSHGKLHLATKRIFGYWDTAVSSQSCALKLQHFIKIRDHCHLAAEYRGAANSSLFEDIDSKYIWQLIDGQ